MFGKNLALAWRFSGEKLSIGISFFVACLVCLLGKNWELEILIPVSQFPLSVITIVRVCFFVGLADSLGRTGESSGSSLDQLRRHRCGQNVYSEGTRSL